jgi:hypothetical protein
MKKEHRLGRALPPIAPAQLDDMTTGALLAQLKRLRWCEESQKLSDLSDEDLLHAAGLILFQSDPAWHTAYIELRDALASQGHVRNKT